MITGFEIQTATLSENEERVAKKVVSILQDRVGKNNIITSIDVRNCAEMWGEDIDGPRFRKIINYIRRKKLIKNLIATSKGYYISNDEKEIAAYKKSLFERANAILDVMHSFS